VASATVGPIGGILSDKFGSRRISAIGLILTTIALILFSRLTTNTTLLEIAIIETISGIGLAFFWPSNTSAIMSATPPAKYGVGSGIMNTFRNTGMILSFALSLTAATSVIPANIVYQLFIGNLTGKLSLSLANSYLSGESFAFEISAGLLIVALAFTLMTGRKKSVLISEGAPVKEPQA
jgi:MFS family permease